jgi:GNAT superfamily N-acetyltransferase
VLQTYQSRGYGRAIFDFLCVHAQKEAGARRLTLKTLAPPRGRSVPYYTTLGFREFQAYTQEIDRNEGVEHFWTAAWMEKILY